MRGMGRGEDGPCAGPFFHFTSVLDPHRNDGPLKSAAKMKRTSAIGVQPKHFHGTDWREMLALVNNPSKTPANDPANLPERVSTPFYLKSFEDCSWPGF